MATKMQKTPKYVLNDGTDSAAKFNPKAKGGQKPKATRKAGVVETQDKAKRFNPKG